VIVDGMEAVVGGGQENISALNTPFIEWVGREKDPELIARSEHAYMAMLDTAEFVAKRYKMSREAQDEYALSSQQRTAAAQAAGRFDAEIVPITAQQAITDKATGAVSYREATLSRDEGNRADTTIEKLRNLEPVRKNGSITAGNASQLSDGASASVVVSEKFASRRGLNPIGRYLGIAVAGCAPEEMGIGPVSPFPTSACGSSMRRSQCRRSIAAPSWPLIRKSTTSTAAAFRSGIRMG
jgi:acetyl-CoA acetyltransferase